MKALTNQDIEHYFKGCKQFGGVFSKDMLPKTMMKKAYIINLQDSDEGSGSHWLAAWNLNGETVYFDSFGEVVAASNIERFMKTTKKTVIRNPHDLQSMATDSCGEFCVMFCAEALKGKKFNDIINRFTSNLVINEHILNEYFGREAFTNESINKSIKKHKLTASGIRDVFNYMKRKATNAVNTVKQLFTGARKFASPPFRHWLESKGDQHINAMKICRRPIKSMIEKLANVLSLGQYEMNKRSNGQEYDKLFHLFLVLQMQDGSVVKLEKNHVIQLENCNWNVSDAECRPVGSRHDITLNLMMMNAEKTVGADRLFLYDAVHHNCQYFVRDLLQSSQLLTNEDNHFIMQDTQAVMKHLGYLERMAKSITDTAAMADVVYNGQGIKKKRKKIV